MWFLLLSWYLLYCDTWVRQYANYKIGIVPSLVYYWCITQFKVTHSMYICVDTKLDKKDQLPVINEVSDKIIPKSEAKLRTRLRYPIGILKYNWVTYILVNMLVLWASFPSKIGNSCKSVQNYIMKNSLSLFSHNKILTFYNSKNILLLSLGFRLWIGLFYGSYMLGYN